MIAIVVIAKMVSIVVIDKIVKVESEGGENDCDGEF